MTAHTPRPSFTATVVTWVALGLLGAVILGVGIALFPVSDSLARDNPEFAGLQAPLLALALAICVCAGTALVATVLTATMLPFIPGPPALALLIIGSVLVGITLFLVLSVLRSQLRRAVLMRVELDEVV